MYVAEDDETAWEEVGPSLLYEYEDVYGDYDDIDHSFTASSDDEAIEELREHAEDRFIIGSPETAIEELERYRDAIDMDEVLLRMHFPGLDTDDREVDASHRRRSHASLPVTHIIALDLPRPSVRSAHTGTSRVARSSRSRR